jgi:hypothetical protein
VSPATPVRACLLAATSLLVAACGPASHGKVASVADRNVEVSRPRPPSDVSVLDPGAQPRAALRYRLRQGLSESLVMDVAVQMKLAVGDLGPPVPVPTVRVSMDLRALAGGPRAQLEGKIVKVEVVDEPAVPPALTAALRSDLDRLAGLSWNAVFTDVGHLELLALPAPADANPQLLKTLDWIREALRVLLPPLPAAPVGKNARWQARRAVTIATARIEETAIYKLAAPDQLAVTLGMDAREQALSAVTPPGTVLTLTSFEGGGKGQIDLALDHIVQPTTLRWAASGKGTATPAGEPPAPVTLGLEAAVMVRRTSR